jgi:hypothetical protein
MITKTFFLVKIIHRIGTRSLHGKKSLHESWPDIGYSSHFGGSAFRHFGGSAARRLGGSVLHGP